jgi:excisionase family DNA binding protein
VFVCCAISSGQGLYWRLVVESMYLTADDLMKKLNVTRAWVNHQVFKKKIPFHKVGHLVRFHKDEIEEYLNKNSVGVVSHPSEINEQQ